MSNASSSNANEAATTTNASGETDTMSEGARILIEAMKTNPEFFGPGSKYHWVVQQLAGARGMSTRDHTVLKAAYDRYVVEPIFTESVIKTTLNVDEPEEMLRFKAEGRYSFGHTDARALFGILNTNTTT